MITRLDDYSRGLDDLPFRKAFTHHPLPPSPPPPCSTPTWLSRSCAACQGSPGRFPPYSAAASRTRVRRARMRTTASSWTRADEHAIAFWTRARHARMRTNTSSWTRADVPSTAAATACGREQTGPSGLSCHALSSSTSLEGDGLAIHPYRYVGG